MEAWQIYNAAFDILANSPNGGGVVRMDAAEFREDSWFNPQTGIGDTNESAETHFIRGRLLQLQELADIFYGDDLAYRVVAKLPQEALKRKPRIVNKRATPEQVTAVNERLDGMEFHSKVRDAATFGRLFGDAGLWMATANDQTEPFRLGERVRFLKPLDRRVLLAAGYYTNAAEENLGTPNAYSVIPVGMTLSHRDLGTQLHETRLPMWHGLKLDSIQRAYNLGWNYSVLQRVYPVIRDMGETWAGISILLRELSIKVLKVKGLQASNTTRPDLVKFRLRLARQSLSTLKMMAIDADTESFERVESGTLTGAAQILEQVLTRVAAAAEMPVTKLYGRSPSGLNSSGDEETREWYDTVATYQQSELRPSMLRVVNAVASGMFPQVRGGWDVEFPSLWQPTEGEAADNANKVADVDGKLISNGVFTPEQIATIRGGPNAHWRPDYTALDISVQQALAKMPPRPSPAPGEDPEDEDGPNPTPNPPRPPAAPVRAPGEPPIPGVVG